MTERSIHRLAGGGGGAPGGGGGRGRGAGGPHERGERLEVFRGVGHQARGSMAAQVGRLHGECWQAVPTGAASGGFMALGNPCRMPAPLLLQHCRVWRPAAAEPLPCRGCLPAGQLPDCCRASMQPRRRLTHPAATCLSADGAPELAQPLAGGNLRRPRGAGWAGGAAGGRQRSAGHHHSTSSFRTGHARRPASTS